MMRNYVIVSMATVAGGEIPLAVGPELYELRDAIYERRDRQERQEKIWPDTNVNFRIFKLRRVPRFIQNVDLTSECDDVDAEFRPEFGLYLESSEELGP